MEISILKVMTLLQFKLYSEKSHGCATSASATAAGKPKCALLVPINCVFFALLDERPEQVLEAVDNVAFHFLRKGNVLVRHDGPKWYLTEGSIL